MRLVPNTSGPQLGVKCSLITHWAEVKRLISAAFWRHLDEQLLRGCTDGCTVFQLHFSPAFRHLGSRGTRGCHPGQRAGVPKILAIQADWTARRSIRVLPHTTGLWLLVGLGHIDFSSIKNLILAFRFFFFSPLCSCCSLGKSILKAWIFDKVFSPTLQKQKELKVFWSF